jgi:hypothetical protein
MIARSFSRKFFFFVHVLFLAVMIRPGINGDPGPPKHLYFVHVFTLDRGGCFPGRRYLERDTRKHQAAAWRFQEPDAATWRHL